MRSIPILALGNQLWGVVAAPASQAATYPTVQTGTTDAGTLGFAWHSFVITRQGNNVTWDVDGRRLATVDISAAGFSTNIFVGYSDQFVSSGNGNPELRFAIVDNLKVETVPLAPETPPQITAIRLISSGTKVQIDFTGSAGNVASGFTLQSSGNVAGGYADVSASIASLGGNSFRAVRAVAGASQFYRVRR